LSFSIIENKKKGEFFKMRNPHPRYMCFPSVAEVGKETKITVRPRDISRVFREDREYELCVLGFRDDMPNYKDPIPKDHPFTVSNGCLHFTHTFEKEQEYSIRFCEKGAKEIRISLYAVEKDLYELRPLKGDLHTHSYYSDGQDGLAMTPADYREEGFDFFALTDHNRMYTAKMAKKLYENVHIDLNIIEGEEVHTPVSMLHIVHIGGKTSVADKYIRHREEYEKEVEKFEEKLTHIPETYRKRVAMAYWACDEIHKAGGLAILPHPFWCPNVYNISKEFCDIVFDEKIFDAFEVFGAVNQKQNNLQLSLWQEQVFKGNNIPIVASSDSHDHDFSKTGFARRFTIVFAKENTTESIIKAIRNGYSVAAEIPMGNDLEIRFCSANFRLVSFAHFLYENYFNETHRLCIGEGILMRRFAEGEDTADALAQLKGTVKEFYERFYGIKEYSKIPNERMVFLDECLDLQKNIGPMTNGSQLTVYGANTRRL